MLYQAHSEFNYYVHHLSQPCIDYEARAVRSPHGQPVELEGETRRHWQDAPRLRSIGAAVPVQSPVCNRTDSGPGVCYNETFSIIMPGDMNEGFPLFKQA